MADEHPGAKALRELVGIRDELLQQVPTVPMNSVLLVHGAVQMGRFMGVPVAALGPDAIRQIADYVAQAWADAQAFEYQLRQANKKIAEVENEAIERAAQVAEEQPSRDDIAGDPRGWPDRVAEKIRALKSSRADG